MRAETVAQRSGAGSRPRAAPPPASTPQFGQVRDSCPVGETERLTQQLPAIEDCHWPIHCLEVVEQAGIDSDTTGLSVPLWVGLERWDVGVEVAAAGAAEVVRDKLRVPPVDSVTVSLRGVKSVGLKVRVEISGILRATLKVSRPKWQRP
jgi:hypothetical protein